MKYCSFENVNPRRELFESLVPHLLMASGVTGGCYPPFTPYFRAQALRTTTTTSTTCLCNFPDTCTSGETQDSEVIHCSFEKLKGVKTGNSHHGISRWHQMFWKDDSERQQGSLVNQSITASYWDFNATFISPQLPLRSKLRLVQVLKAMEHVQESWAEHGESRLLICICFPKAHVTAWQAPPFLIRKILSDSISLPLLSSDTHSLALNYRSFQEHLAKSVAMFACLCSRLSDEQWAFNQLQKRTQNGANSRHQDTAPLHPKALAWDQHLIMSYPKQEDNGDRAQTQPGLPHLHSGHQTRQPDPRRKPLGRASHARQSKRFNPYTWTETFKTKTERKGDTDSLR